MKKLISCTRCCQILSSNKKHICRDISEKDYIKKRTVQLLSEGFTYHEILWLLGDIIWEGK